MCTKDDLIVVHDDGMFSAENNLVRFFLHSSGVDYDGYGSAKQCSAFGGYLMGSGLPRLPLEFSHCTMRLAYGAFSHLTCITSKMSKKAHHPIPSPPKVTRHEFCGVFGAEPCDDKGMDKYEHKRSEASFALRGSMCTAHNIAVVKDDGAFDMVNHLLKVMLYAFGVDVDGEGYARKCLNSAGFLMGSGKLNVPFSYSYCTRAQITPVLRRLSCLRPQMKSKTSKGLPMPRKIARTDYCDAIGAVNCDIVTKATSYVNESTQGIESGKATLLASYVMPLYGRLKPFEGDKSTWFIDEEQVLVFFRPNETPVEKQRDIFLASCGT
ncbi:hypothetical protein MRX96_045904 [Rhipicephalus microplus]